MDTTDRIEIYRSRSLVPGRAGWRWRYRAHNGHVLAHGGQAYSRRVDMLTALARVHRHHRRRPRPVLPPRRRHRPRRPFRRRRLGRAMSAAADRPALTAALRAVLDLHRAGSAQVITGDCASETCGHEDECPTVKFAICLECARIAEETYPYYGEQGQGINPVAWPCLTVRAIEAAMGGEQR